MPLRSYASLHLKQANPRIGASYHPIDPEDPCIVLTIRDADQKGAELTIHMSVEQAENFGNVVSQAIGDAIRGEALYPVWFPLTKGETR